MFSSTSASFFGFSGLASFVAASFVGLLIGTLLFSYTADRSGRRVIFTWSLLWYSAASVVMAFQYSALHILIWRVIAGIGLGVELVTIDAYIAELVPKELRGRAFAFNSTVQFCALPLVALAAWLLVPRHPLGLDGWRWVVLIGAAGAIFVWFIRQGVPESPRWLITHGKLAEADRVVTALEAQVQSGIKRRTAGCPSRSRTEEAKGSFADIFRAPYLGRTVMLVVFQFFQTSGYYGFASWVPTLMISAGITTTLSLRYSFLIALAAPLGPLMMISIADRTERKWQIVVSATCIGVFGLLFAAQRNPVFLVACGVILTCSNNCMSYAFHTYQSELFPTRVRAQAVGFVYSWSRLSAIFGSFLIGFFLRDFGVTGVFAFIAASMLVVVLSIGIFGPRTRGLALEAISR